MNNLLKKLVQLKQLGLFLFHGAWYFLSAVFGRFPKKTFTECLTVILMVVLFFLSSTVLRWLDPTAGTFDAGVLQTINLTLVKYAVFLLVTWFSFGFIWPDLRHFMIYYFKSTFNQLTPWQKILFSSSIYCFHLLTLVVLSILGI